MTKNKQHISPNRVVGELMTREKYMLIDGRIISAIVNDVFDMLDDDITEQEDACTQKKE